MSGTDILTWDFRIKERFSRHGLMASLALCVGLLTAAPAFAAAECTPDYYDGLRAYDAGNREASVQIWQQSALEGDVRSQHRLGQIFQRGESSVLINFVEAHRWYNLAANNDLQNCSGDLGSREARLARDNAREARDQLQDSMTYRSISEALDLVVDTYECRSDARALYELGRIYQAGTGLPQSSVDACRYFAVAAYKGEASAKDALDVLNDILQPDQIDNCQREAQAWSAPTAAICSSMAGLSQCVGSSQVPVSNRQAALKALGFYNDTIDGVRGPNTRAAIAKFQRNINATVTRKLSESQICSLIERAAANGDGYSQATLGEMYYRGLGKSKNISSAANWLEQAADRGVPGALFRLGLMNIQGEVGNQANPVLGCEYLRRARTAGHPAAQAEIGRYCTSY